MIEGREGEEGENENSEIPPIPDDQLAVYCISANDYLKIKRIKPPTDGAPNAFVNVDETLIPALRGFVHDTTSNFRTTFTEGFVDYTCNLLDNVKLVASDAKGVSTSGRASRRYKAAFDKEMQVVDGTVQLIVNEFLKNTGTKAFGCSVRLSMSMSLTAYYSRSRRKNIVDATSFACRWSQQRQTCCTFDRCFVGLEE